MSPNGWGMLETRAVAERPAAASRPLLATEHLTVAIRSGEAVASVLEDVQLEVPERGTVAIVGESGCGKTMLARAMSALLPPAASVVSGGVVWRGADIAGFPETRLCRYRGGDVGSVFQEPLSALDPVLSIGAQIEEAVRLQSPGLAESRARAVALLEEVGFPSARLRFGEYPHRLSGGMRQRVLLAIALAGDPALVIADEPTASLDAVSSRQILDRLDELRRSRGLSLVLITHDLRLAERWCAETVVLYAGRVVERGPSAALFGAPLHPYTRALRECAPTLQPIGRVRGARYPVIRGTVPGLFQRPGGCCGFAPRCPEAFEKCRVREPAEFARGAVRVRCFLHE